MRVAYIDNFTKWRAIYVPSAKSSRLCGIELSLREILSRVPTLENLFQMTFGEVALTEAVAFDEDLREDGMFTIRIDDPELFTDRDSLRGIVTRWRGRFPFLKDWTLTNASHGWGNSIIIFRNTRNTDIDDFSEQHLTFEDETFFVRPEQDVTVERFSPEEALASVASAYPNGGTHAISPVNGCSISEYSIHYLALFLLSSLVRYRPQTWMHALSRSVMPDAPADDQAISLIEQFLDVNSGSIQAMIVGVLNPQGYYA